MKALAREQVSGEVVKTLWLQRLPPHIQLVLSSMDGMDTEKLAVVADKLSEIPMANIMAVGSDADIHAMRTPHGAPTQRATAFCNEGATDPLTALQKQVTELSAKIEKLSAARWRQRDRSQSRSRNRAQQRQDGADACYFHKNSEQKLESVAPM